MTALNIKNIALTDAFDKAFVAFDVHRGEHIIRTGEFIRNAALLVDYTMPGENPSLDWVDGNMAAYDDFSADEREQIAQHVDAVLELLVDYSATLDSARATAVSEGPSDSGAHAIQVAFEDLFSIDNKLYDMGCTTETDWSLDFDAAIKGSGYEREATVDGTRIIVSPTEAEAA